jgi:hypothetical protein
MKDESDEIIVKLSLKKESLLFNSGRVIFSMTDEFTASETDSGDDEGILASGIL